MSGCLVLNSAFQPLNGMSEEEAICKIVEGLAWPLKEDKNKPYRAQNVTIYAPKIIVLYYYQEPTSFKIKPEKLTNAALFRRDGYTCQYCGKLKAELGGMKLTRDHVHPIAKGGQDTWLNVVTACASCNLKKADRTPKEAGMKLINPVSVPVTWTVRGKAKIGQEEIAYIENLLNLKTRYISADEAITKFAQKAAHG